MKKALTSILTAFVRKRTEVKSAILLEGQDWAVLNFQKTGTVPLNPSNDYLPFFEERVITFLMATRQIYLGNEPLNAG